MGLDTKKILGVNVTTASKLEILEEIRKYLTKVPSTKAQGRQKSKVPLVIFTPNPEIIVYAPKDDHFRKIINSAQINIPDGWGVVWALKKMFGLTVERVTGVDLMLDLCSLASKNGARVGLIGGRGGVALESLECLKRQFPNLKGWAMEGPELEISNIKNQKSKIQTENQKRLETTSGVAGGSVSGRHDSPEVEGSDDRYFSSLANEISKRKTALLFVGLGFPKQEYFISLLTSHFSLLTSYKPLVLMAVGGAFDYFSGRVPRAPEWIRDRGLEWLYRLIREPWRLLRQVKGVVFFYRVK